MIGAALVELCETAGLSFADATRRAGRTWGIFSPDASTDRTRIHRAFAGKAEGSASAEVGFGTQIHGV